MRKHPKSEISQRTRNVLAAAMVMATVIPPTAIFAGSGGASDLGGLPGVAAREITRRLESAQNADAIAADGDALAARGDYAGAIVKYRQALEILPVANATEVQRQSIIQRFSVSAIAQARKIAGEGDYVGAKALLQEVLLPTRDPNNVEARTLLTQLDDPDRFPPARDPQHTLRVNEVVRLLQLGESYYLIGDYDKAETEFFKVLQFDKTNIAAREFLEKIERTRIDYYGAAYNHTRARMLGQVDAAWVTKPPLQGPPKSSEEEVDNSAGVDLRTDNSNALQAIVIPKIDFQEVTLAEAVDFLRSRSREFDRRPGRTNENRGVNILIRTPRTVADQTQSFGEKVIPELRLTNVPLGEALRYLGEMTGMRVKIEQFAIVLVPISDNDADLYTRTFRVPPDFIPSDGDEGGAAAGAVEDPFAAADGAGGGAGLKKRRGAKEYLESLGVPFGEGASGNFNGRSSTLTIRNTPQAMELIEQIVDDSFKAAPKQVTIETKFVEVSQHNGKELGFDWLLGPATINTGNGVVVSGGSVGNGAAVQSIDYGLVDPLSVAGLVSDPQPVGRNPVTAGNRSGDFGVTRNAIDSLLNRSIADVGADSKAPGILSIAGLLTEPQFQVVIRALDQKKGADLLSAPSVTTKSGMPAQIEIIREFIYPTEYDPPEIPNSFGNNLQGSNNSSSLPGLNPSPATVSTFPVTPATPTAFETRNVGVTLEVDPVVGANGYTIDLNLNPEVVEFEGFINYGSPITSGAIDALGRPTTVVITENRIEMPIFATRRVKTQVTVWDGQTVAIGGLIREDVQDIEDKVPILGDLPLVGRLFKTKSEDRFKRNLMVFVTARLINPAGKPVNDFSSEEGMVVPPAPVADPAMGNINPGLIDGGLPTLAQPEK